MVPTGIVRKGGRQSGRRHSTRRRRCRSCKRTSTKCSKSRSFHGPESILLTVDEQFTTCVLSAVCFRMKGTRVMGEGSGV